jgi:hypothetical protein
VQGEVVAFDLGLWASCNAAPGPLDGMSLLIGIEFRHNGDDASIAGLTPAGGAFAWTTHGGVKHAVRFTRTLCRRSTVTGICVDRTALVWTRLAAQAGHWSKAEQGLLAPADHDASDLLRRLRARMLRHGGDPMLTAAAEAAAVLYDGTTTIVKRRQRGSVAPLTALARACNLQTARAVPQLLIFNLGRCDVD